MIDINEITQSEGIYTVKYFADGIEPELTTPILEEQLLSTIVDNNMHEVIVSNTTGETGYIPPSEFLREFTNEVVIKYLSQPATPVTMTIDGKLYNAIITELKQSIKQDFQRVKFLTDSPLKGRYAEALVSKATRLELDKEFIQSITL